MSPGPQGGSAWFEAIDWDRPWLAPWQAQAPAVVQGLKAGRSVADVLNGLAQAREAAGGKPLPVRFAPQAALPPGHAYEDFIFRQRQVPTRDNAHDLFNGLAWLAFPEAKARLNALQAAEIEAHGVQATRGPLRDALTLFDENAALVLAPAPLRQALQARQWQRLFVDLRPLWAQARVWVFGHAALEKLVVPRKPITAHVYLPQADLDARTLDESLAADLSAAHLAQKPYAPLPILGIPGWWPENADSSFYADDRVFRPPAQP